MALSSKLKQRKEYIINLHSHSGDGSLGDGFGKVGMWMDALERRGITCHAVTDHGVLTAIPQFYNEGKKRGIRIIAGMEGYIIPEYDGYRVDDHGNRVDFEGKGTHIFRHKYRHIVLLAMNDTGWKNLIKINNEAWRNGYFRGRGRFDYATLFKYNEGIICLTACVSGIISYPFASNFYADKAEYVELADAKKESKRLLKKLISVFGDRLYVEFMLFQSETQQHVNRQLIKLVRKYNLQIVTTNDCHYPEPEFAKFRETLREFRYRSSASGMSKETDEDNANKEFDIPELYPRSIDEIMAVYESHYKNILTEDEIKQAINNTKIIADRCSFELNASLKLPSFDTKSHIAWKDAKKDEVYIGENGKDKDRLLLHLARIGYENETGKKWDNKKWKKLIDKRIEKTGEKYMDQLYFEYNVVREAGFVDYFLIVEDIVRYCMDVKGRLYGQGRGSVAGSVLSWFLGISRDDPFEYGLYFERFLNPGRVNELPDIDLDFPKDIRDNIKDYISNKYGSSRVVNIGTIAEIKAKSALQRVATAFDYTIDGEVYDYGQMQKITHSIPNAVAGGVKIETIEDAISVCGKDENNPFTQFYNKHSEWIKDNVELMVNHPNSYGQHAAGVIISPQKIDECIPIRFAESVGGKKTFVSQWRDKDLLPLGFLKMDILGLDTLGQIEFAKKLIKTRHGAVLPPIGKLNKNDTKTFNDVLTPGKTNGVFQLNSPMFQRYLKELKPSEYSHIYTTTALLRPGPMMSDMHKKYIELVNGDASPEYMDEIMIPALERTGGLMVFQEQVMRLAVDMAGYTLEEADNMRSIIGKKKKDKMPAEREKFINGCVANKIDEDTAIKTFEQIEYFAGYGFNASHAVAYSDISMYQAYIKAHYPLEFWASKLQAGETNTEDRESVWVLRSLAMDDGIRFGEFSVNTCGPSIRVGSDNKLYWRLDFIKGVGTPAATIIRKCAPYSSATELIKKTTEYFKKLKEESIKAGTPMKGRGSPIGKGVMVALIAAGALDAIYPDGTTRFDIATEYMKLYYGKKWDLINGYIAMDASDLLKRKISAPMMRDIKLINAMSDPLKMIGLQHTVLRFSPRPYWKTFQKLNSSFGPGIAAAMVHRAATGTPVRVYGMVNKLEVKKYSKGKMLVGTISEYDGPVRFIMWNEEYQANRNIIKMIEGEPFIWITGHVKDDHYSGGKQIMATSIGSVSGVENLTDEDILF